MNDVIHELAIGGGRQEDLNGKIQRLRNYSKNSDPEKVAVPDEIIKRCDDIRNTRNRLVHSTGMKKNTLKADAEFILGGINVILDWYQSITKPKEVQTAISNQGNSSVHIKARVFLSTISPHSVE